MGTRTLFSERPPVVDMIFINFVNVAMRVFKPAPAAMSAIFPIGFALGVLGG
jgi:hypothetical protein